MGSENSVLNIERMEIRIVINRRVFVCLISQPHGIIMYISDLFLPTLKYM